MAETWLLNSSIGSINSVDVNITFTSNNTSFSRFHFLGSNESSYYYLYYDTTLAYDTDDYGTYTNQAYRTITFETAPTGDLLTWLQANGTKQSNKLSVDLTTLSGWSNLAPGNHTIKIVAKGTGYRDSKKSAGVEVTKPSSGYADCLTFTGESSEFTLKAKYKEWNGTVEYSTDHNTWTVWNGSAVSSVGKKLYLRGSGNTTFYTSDGAQFVLSARVACSGNIQTLLEYSNPPATILAEGCYRSMFYGCSSLTKAPELPATILAEDCYRSMFQNCTNLTTAPELPATSLTSGCYNYMFNGCTKLKVNASSGNKIFTCPATIPSLAVTNMFYNTGGSFKGTPTAGNTYYWTE